MKNIYQNFCRTMIFNASALFSDTIVSPEWNDEDVGKKTEVCRLNMAKI